MCIVRCHEVTKHIITSLHDLYQFKIICEKTIASTKRTVHEGHRRREENNPQRTQRSRSTKDTKITKNKSYLSG